LLSVTILLSRLLGLIQQVILSSTLPPIATDAYKMAFRLTDFVNYLVAGGAISVTFIPIFTQLRESGRERDAWRFFSIITSIMGVALVLVLTLSFVVADSVARWYALGFDAERLELTVLMTRIILPAQAFFYLGGLLVGVLNAHKRFGASSMTSAVYNLVAIVVGVTLWLVMGQNPLGFAWGILTGAFCGNFLLPLLAARSGPPEERPRFRFSLDWRYPPVQKFFRNSVPIMLGVSFPVIDQIVIGPFVSLLPTGAPTHLDNGNRVMLAPLTMLAQAASVAAFPFLAEDSAAHNWKKLSDFLRQGLRRLVFLALPLSILLILLAQPIITLIFRYGQYTQAASDQTAIAFAFYCVGMFAWAGQQFVARGFYALQDTLTPTIIGSLITIFFFVPLTWLVIHLGFGIAGLAMATSIGAAAHFSFLLMALEKRLSQKRYNAPLHSERIMSSLLRTSVACVAMGLAGALATYLTPDLFVDERMNDLIRMLSVSVVASLTFASAAQIFRVPEWEWLRDKILRRRKATRPVAS
jgi:putative peptidoglycan lipid II flippase